MYGNFNRRKSFKKGKKMSATKKAYLAGIRRGKALANRSRFKGRWH